MGVSYSSVVEAALQYYFAIGAQPPPVRLRKHGSRKRVTQSSVVEAALVRYLDDMERPPPSPEELQAAWQRMERVLRRWGVKISGDADREPNADERDPSKLPN
jgi:hypothetical protein